MKRNQFLNFFLCVLMFALCGCDHGDRNITIKGNIKGLTSKQIYFYNIFPVGNKPPFDSVKVTDEQFVYHLKCDTIFQTRLIRIGTSSSDPKSDLPVIDPIKSKKGNKNYSESFLMETGTTEITGDLSKDQGINVKGGIQNDFFFQHPDLPYINLSHNAAKRRAQINRFIETVKQTPNAYWAFYALNNWALSTTNGELKQLYAAFDESVQNSYDGRKIKEILDTRPAENAKRPNAMLLDTNGNQQPMIDASKKINMIVFWASWCHPCRQEIPVIKQLAAKIKDKRFRLVSVSIDKKATEWKNALAKEQMPWQQLNAQNATMDRLKIQYNINFIPQIYLIDCNGKLLKRVSGMDEKSIDQMDQTINGYLN